MRSTSAKRSNLWGRVLYSALFTFTVGWAAMADTKVAAISFSPPEDAPVDVAQSVVDKYKERTASALERYIREAARNGAKLVVTPEFSTVGYPDIADLPPEEDEFQNRGQISPYVETLTGKTVKRFSKLAEDLGIYLVVGIAEHDKATGKYYNTLVALSPKGKTVQTYRKIHLFEGEKNFLSAGSERKYFDTDFGRIGLFTCFDIHFEHPSRDLVSKDKVNVIAFGTSWVGRGGMATFRSFAKNNRVYFIAANHTYFPDSGVINPDGSVQEETQGSGPVYGTIKGTR